MEYVLGVDVGTQGTKGVFLDNDLEVIAKEYVEHEVNPQKKPGWMEHDAEKVWWGGFRRTLTKLLKQVSFPPDEIVGIGCSGLGINMLPLSKEGSPIRPALLYSDTRASEEVKEMNNELGDKYILRKTKNSLSTQFAGPRILWFKKNEPNKFDKTSKIVTTSNYLVYKLTGNLVLDYPQAAFFGPFFDYPDISWDEKILGKFDVSPDLLPDLQNPTEIAGEITEEIANKTGLSKGTPVVTGTIDALAEAVSMGSFSKGIVTLIYGTTSVITSVSKKANSHGELLTVPHPVLGDHNLIIGATATAGALTKWFRDNFGYLEKEVQEKLGINAYQLLSQEAAQVPPGAEGLLILPYFSGERTPINDELARGLIIGLTTYHTKRHLYRALLESTGYAFKHNLDVLKDLDLDIEEMIASGGGTKDELWPQMVSDITGQEQVIPVTSTGAEIGAAYLAGLATGVVSNHQELKETIHKGGERLNPDKKKHNFYQKYYGIYRGLYEQTKDAMHSLAKLGEQTL